MKLLSNYLAEVDRWLLHTMDSLKKGDILLVRLNLPMVTDFEWCCAIYEHERRGMGPLHHTIHLECGDGDPGDFPQDIGPPRRADGTVIHVRRAAGWEEGNEFVMYWQDQCVLFSDPDVVNVWCIDHGGEISDECYIDHDGHTLHLYDPRKSEAQRRWDDVRELRLTLSICNYWFGLTAHLMAPGGAMQLRDLAEYEKEFGETA